MNSIKALLFDLGGVVIDIDFNLVFLHWAKCSNQSVEEIVSRFSFDQFYDAHERGEIDSNAYFQSLRKSLGIDISDEQFETGWNSIFKGDVPGIFELLQKAQTKMPLYAFTNSNHLHQKVWSKKFAKTLTAFQSIFNSSAMGKRKPEPAAFQMIADTIGINLGDMVFYDDSIENIMGAKKAGLNAVHVRSIKDIEESFEALFP